MTEPIEGTRAPGTVASLSAGFRALGVRPGDVVLVHSSLRSLGYVVGGAHAVVMALLRAVGEEGTVVVPTHSGDLTDPAHWEAPPVPEAWWPVIRAEAPGYDPDLTPTRAMGAIADALRTHPDARRSGHPHTSFAAVGPKRDAIVSAHPLGDRLGDGSPLGRIYQLDGRVLLIGVGHANNTSLHLAEERAGLGRAPVRQGAPLRDGDGTRWVEFEAPPLRDDDFVALGEELERTTDLVQFGEVGEARCRLMRQRPVVDWAADWLARHRRTEET